MDKLTTPRLELVPATLALLQAELESPARLSASLDARVPEGWPPGEYDRGAIEYFAARLGDDPQGAGWYGWYAVLRDGRALVAAGGFFGPPGAERQVELGYSVVRSFEGRGYATELAGALVEHAFSTGRVDRVVAHTTRANPGSIKVLEKAGFRLAGPGPDPGSLEYLRCAHSLDLGASPV